MDVDSLHLGVAYKYYVTNSAHQDEYENLHGLSATNGGIRNRYLKTNQEGNMHAMFYMGDNNVSHKKA